jgi:3-oxoacyl-[acyl-carrier protein] reductase
MSLNSSLQIHPDLKGKNIFITGGTRGIGAAICRELARQQCRLSFTYRSFEQLNEYIEELKTLGAQDVYPLKVDLSKASDIEEAIPTLLKEWGAPQGVVLNAGISKDQLALRVKRQDIEEVLAINLMAPMHVTSLLSRSLLKTGGSVVTISSIVGLMGNAGQAVYAASKSGLIGWSKSLAMEFGAKNLRFNIIAPGFIETDMTGELSEEVKGKYGDKIPMRRFGRPSEVADCVTYLLSASSSYINGEVLKIDGGLYT